METVTTPDSSDLAPGWTFWPPDRELTDKYLRDALAGKPVPGCIHHVDVYSADPEHLVEELEHAPGTGKGDKKPPVWYFFSPVGSAAGSKTAGGRKARAVIGGTWHQENKKAVKGSTIGGYVKTFTYVNKSSLGGKWIMKEFDVPPQEGGGRDRVLCKIYRTPRPVKSRVSSSITTWSSSSSSYAGESKKRKAVSAHRDAPAPSAPRTSYDGNHFTENVGHVFIEGSGDSEHYDTAAYYYGTTTHMPGGETMEVPTRAQESFFPSTEYYGTTNTQGNYDNFMENDGHVFMQESGESDHYGAAAYYQHMPGGETMELPPWIQERYLPSSDFYGTATHVPGGDTMELLPCAQESLLPLSGFYGTTGTQGSDLEVPQSMESAQYSFLPSSELYATTHMQRGGLEVPPLMDLDDLYDLLKKPPSDYQPSEEEMQAMILELS